MLAGKRTMLGVEVVVEDVDEHRLNEHPSVLIAFAADLKDRTLGCTSDHRRCWPAAARPRADRPAGRICGPLTMSNYLL